MNEEHLDSTALAAVEQQTGALAWHGAIVKHGSRAVNGSAQVLLTGRGEVPVRRR